MYFNESLTIMSPLEIVILVTVVSAFLIALCYYLFKFGWLH